MKPILLIEDAPHLTRKYIHTFESAGYTVRHVINAPTAMQLIQQSPDGYLLVCCFLIIRGPYVTAFQFVDAVRQNQAAKNLPFLLLTVVPDDVESPEVWKAQRPQWELFDEKRIGTALRYDMDDILAAITTLLSKSETGLKN